MVPSHFSNAISTQDILDQILISLHILHKDLDGARIPPFIFTNTPSIMAHNTNDSHDSPRNSLDRKSNNINLSSLDRTSLKDFQRLSVDAEIAIISEHAQTHVHSTPSVVIEDEIDHKKKPRRLSFRKKIFGDSESSGSEKSKSARTFSKKKKSSRKEKKKPELKEIAEETTTTNEEDSTSDGLDVIPQIDIPLTVGKIEGKLLNTKEFMADVKQLSVRMNSNGYRRSLNSNFIRENMEKEKRILTIREIATTERNFISDLHILYHSFYEELVQSNVIPIEDLDIIFSPSVILNITGISTVLLDSIEKELDKDNMNIGGLFVEVVEEMKEYSKFINTFDLAMNTYKKMVGAFPDFKREIETIQLKDVCKKKALDDFMISVVQRIPRYRLLLEDLLKYTPESHSDYIPVKIALDQIGDLAAWLNTQKSLDERKKVTEELIEELNLGDEDQIFIFEEYLYRSEVPTDRKLRAKINTKYKIILFDKNVVLAKYKFEDVKSVKQSSYEKITIEPSDEKEIKINGKRYYCISGFKRRKLIQQYHEIAQF
eukprot:TRINITY_DN10250_c0_g1_i1.p1 TRINITY_DN10250_c0_g1~~TRINITY_DN10250_c0_g1_i1.p1  ORF type:complete len:574 (+),score=128.14 TRINITY_DN10250_c0_g1_i1:92-1723(+)